MHLTLAFMKQYWHSAWISPALPAPADKPQVTIWLHLAEQEDQCH